MSGVEVEEYVSMAPGDNNKVQFGSPDLEEPFTVSVWADVLEVHGAQVAATYAADYYAQKPAVTINLFGKGKVIYLGAMGDAAFYAGVTQWIIELANLQPLLETPQGVEVGERWNGNQRLLFILNHTQQEQEIHLHGSYTNILTETEIQGKIKIAAIDFALLAAVVND
jgi:beta-galactosidase